MSSMAEPTYAENVALLERTPRVLSALLAGLPASWLDGTDTPDGWRARDVLGHLISAEIDDWIPRAELIAAHGAQRPFEPFDRFAHVERDRDVPMSALLPRFAELRNSNLARLRELVRDETDLDREGTHPSLGRVTMRQLIATWAVHDLDHFAQALAALSAGNDAAVGPWKHYLGILLRREDPTAQPG
jgi:hypothetical protein